MTPQTATAKNSPPLTSCIPVNICERSPRVIEQNLRALATSIWVWGRETGALGAEAIDGEVGREGANRDGGQRRLD